MGEDVFHLGLKGLISNKAGKVLLLKVNEAKLRGNNLGAYWDLPGGRIQKGEDVQSALAREIEEETGITKILSTEDVGFVLSNIRIPDDNGGSFGLILGIYRCVVSDDVVITLSDEHTAYEWLAPAEAAKLLATKYPSHFCELIAKL